MIPPGPSARVQSTVRRKFEGPDPISVGGGYGRSAADVAQRLGAIPMQVALAWLLRRSSNILLIPGTSSVAHLRENLAAGEVVLPSDALVALDGIAARAGAATS